MGEESIGTGCILLSAVVHIETAYEYYRFSYLKACRISELNMSCAGLKVVEPFIKIFTCLRFEEVEIVFTTVTYCLAPVLLPPHIKFIHFLNIYFFMAVPSIITPHKTFIYY